MNETDPNGIPAHAPGAKLDEGKPRIGLLFSGFPQALRAVAEVATYGANKYSEGGWKSVPNGISRYTDAMGRHLLAEAEGPLDESGMLHAAQVAWNALARLELMTQACQCENHEFRCENYPDIRARAEKAEARLAAIDTAAAKLPEMPFLIRNGPASYEKTSVDALGAHATLLRSTAAAAIQERDALNNQCVQMANQLGLTAGEGWEHNGAYWVGRMFAEVKDARKERDALQVRVGELEADMDRKEEK